MLDGNGEGDASYMVLSLELEDKSEYKGRVMEV